MSDTRADQRCPSWDNLQKRSSPIRSDLSTETSAELSAATTASLRAWVEPEPCIICLDASPPPIQSGCACRGDSGFAHIDCRVQAAVSQQAQQRFSGWWQCQTCKQHFMGATRARAARLSRVSAQVQDSEERLAASR